MGAHVASGSIRVNSPIAACQVIDGEAVLIHFDTGGYFSSLGTGGEIIRLLELGYTVEQTIAAFAARYADADDTAIRGFVEQLLSERLFVPGASHVVSGEASLALSESEFTSPRLEKYLELDDLLKLDPIHDADPAGWPLREAD